MGAPKLDKQAVRAFLDLPWHVFDDAKASWSRQRYERDPGAAFRTSEDLRAHFHSLGNPISEAERLNDLETHLRVRRLLDLFGDHTSR